jgi:glutamate-ammonia-ligase adenylyltransferase
MTLAPAAFALPRGFDKAAAALAQAHFADKGEAERRFAESAEGAAILEALGGHSPYLADLAVREGATLLFMAERGPDDAFARAIDPLTRLDPATPRPA